MLMIKYKITKSNARGGSPVALPNLRWRDPIFWSMAMRLALPVAIQNLLISSFALVDTLMVGQLGDVPLSAIGMATQWAWLLNICQFGFCNAHGLELC